MASYSIRVKVNGQTVVLSKDNLADKFTVRDLVAACRDYQIPTEGGYFIRSGSRLGNDSEILNNDFMTIEFPKGGGGRF